MTVSQFPKHNDDTNLQSVKELEQRIAVLERKASRERSARNLAESELERYSLEIYQTNKSLKRALDFSTKKQFELEYLGKTSMAVSSELPLYEMIKNIVELTCQYCSAKFGVYFVTEDGSMVDGMIDNAWEIEYGWQTKSELQTLINENLPLNQTDEMESWYVSPVTDDTEEFGWAVYINFSLSDGRLVWLAFLSEVELVEDEILPILATVRDNLTSGIRRRLTDVRILKRNEQLQDSVNKLESAKRQLIQSGKMAALGQLAAGVAHEINNPIAFIRSNMQVLKEYIEDFKKLHDEIRNELAINKSLDAIFFDVLCEKAQLSYIEEDSADSLNSNIEGLNRVSEIVESLKSFSHSGDVKQVQISIKDCVEAALKISGNVFKYEHQVDNQLTNSSPLILGSLGQLQQVFVNLFVNAAYAMEGGGKLSLFQTEDSNRLIIHVRDTGTGMDKETVEKLFTPFFTTKPVGVGTGLGLSVSYAILEAHDAQVTVDSEIGVGTTFNLSFPIVNA